MIDIILVKNIFDDHPTTEVQSKDYIAGMTLAGYVDMRDKDAYACGMWVRDPKTFYVKDGMQLLILPHVAGKSVKKVLGTILTIGLMIAAPHMFAAWSSLALRALASGAVMILGGKIINSIFHLNQAASRGVDDQSSPTYGWELPNVQTQEGGVIGETFGECIPAPQFLMYHVETTNSTDQNINNQYLNVLYCGGYGPVDSITDIRIGHTPIENFSDVQIETRLGTNNQKPISLFPNTVADMSISMSLTEGKPVIRSTDASNCNRVDVTFEFPSGLYRLNNDGNRENCTAHIRVDYRRTGTSTWMGGEDLYITRSTNSAVRYTQAFNGLESGRYDVKVTPISLPNSSRDSSYCTWSLLSCFTYDGAYERPNKVLVALRIKATSQLNAGVPDINWRQKRTTGYAWNPETQAYENVNLRNPVWAAYDILHHCRKLFNVNTQTEEYHVDGCPKERFTQYWDQWQAAADYADEDVKNADGSTEPRFRFDAYYDTSLRRYEAANKALAVAHATLVRHGLQLGVVVDKPGVIHQVFGEGRTLISSVKGEFSATEDRAHSLQVTYNDTQNDFKNTEFFIRSDAYASAEANGQDNTAQLSLFGVSSRTQAYREAVYALATNERQLQTIQFSADVNAFVCEYGDLIGVNSQVPRIGVASGRIVSVSGTTVKLDKTVTFTKGEAYTVMFQLSTNDALISREVTAFTADTTTDTITVTAAFDDGAVPAALDNYVLGLKDKAAKPFRITKIERDGDQKVSITAVEYDDAVFELDYSKYPKIDYATPPQLMAPTNLNLVEQVYKNYAGVKTSRIYASWDMPKNAKYDDFHVYYSWDGENWTRVNTVFGTCATIENVTPPLTYHVKVCSVIDGIESKPVATTVQCTGHVEPAVAPTDLTAIEKYAFLSDGTPHYSITINWKPDKLTGQVYYKRTGTQAQNAVLKDGVAAEKTGYSSDWTFAGTGANQLTISPAIAGEYYKIAVCTADELGLYTDADSAPYTEIYVEPKKLIPNTPDNVSLIFDEASHISWDSVTNCDIKYYEIRTDTNAGADDAGLLARTNRLSTTVPLKSRTGTVCVFACSTDHKYSRPAVLQYNKTLPAAPTIDAQAGIGNLRLQVGAIPAGCLGVDYYINDQLEKTKNTTINHAVKTAGIYDVAAAYYDLFGEGEKSITLHVYVTDKVDQQFLADNAVALKNVDQDIKTAVNNANMAIPRITSLDSEVNGIVNNLNLDPGSSVYKSISDLNKSETELSSTFATMKASQDKVNTSVDTQISQIKQDTATIQTTVIDNKKAQDAQNTSFISQITQNATNISSVVTGLTATQKDLADTKTKVDSNYTAIVQTQNDIAMRVKTGELIQQINLSEEGISINGSKIHITGDTVFDNGIIVSSYIGDSQVVGTKIADGAISTAKLSANSVTSNELASNSVTTEKIEAGAITTDRIAAGAVTAESIRAGAITADKLTSGAVTADKLAAKEINMAGALKIVGGAVTLDENGMTVKEAIGGSVQFGQRGMSFIDSNGHAFAGIGRFCTGTVNDGQTVKFANSWDVTPAVFLFPIRLQTSAVGYTNVNMYQDVEAINVSKEGFTAVCKSILKAGSGASFPLSWTCTGAKDAGDIPVYKNAPASYHTENYSYNINIPTTATHIWITGEVAACRVHYYSSYNDTIGWDAADKVSITISTNTGERQGHTNYLDGGKGTDFILVDNNGFYRATAGFTFDMAVSNVSTVTVTFSFYGECYSVSYGKLTSYRTNLDSDVTVCHGTAGFIAIDPNTVPYSVS